MPLDTTIPSTRLLQEFIKSGQGLRIKLTTGDQFQGKLLWLDPDFLCLEPSSGQQVLLARVALVLITPE